MVIVRMRWRLAACAGDLLGLVMDVERGGDKFVLAVCGGRDFHDRHKVYATLDRVHAKRPVTLLIHGASSGADTLAGGWAESRGITVLKFPANWKYHGRAAGPRRNTDMVSYGLDGLVAFPGGIGTADMVRQCRAAKVTVMVVS